MRQLSEQFQNHLDGEVITLCNCWQLTKADKTIMGFTDHDKNILFDDISHGAISGFQASAMEESAGLSPDNQDVMGVLQSEKITSEDIEAGAYDNSTLRHYSVNWSTPSERTLMSTYLIREIKLEDGSFRASVTSISAKIDQTNVRRFQKTCSADLGDKKCGLDIENLYAQTVTVLSVDEKGIFVSGLSAYQTGWFRQGRAKFEGNSVEIAEHINLDANADRSLLQFWNAMGKPIQKGDQITITPGCNKYFSTCKNKFQNQLNFRGFPHIPGPQFALSYAANSHELDGGPIYES